MPPLYFKLPVLVTMWVFIALMFSTLELAMSFLRPWSLDGGKIGHIFALWHFMNVDRRYMDTNDLVTMGVARLTFIETVMLIFCTVLFLWGSRHTMMLTFTTAAFVFWKTAVYSMLYVAVPPGNPDFVHHKHSTIGDAVLFWTPHVVWLSTSFLVMLKLWAPLTVPVRGIYVGPRRRIPKHKVHID